MITTFLSQDDWTEYDCYVETHPSSTFEHTRRWAEILARHFKFVPMIIVHKNEVGKIDGVLTLFKTQSLFGARLVSTPYAVSTGILGDNPVAERGMLSFARELANKENISFLEVREPEQNENYVSHFRRSQAVFNFSLMLNADAQRVLLKLPKSSVRWGIKTAEKSGITWRWGNSVRDLDGFYRLFLITRKFRGVPGYPYSYFKQILGCFGDTARIYTAFYEEKPIASIFLLYHKKEIRYAFSGSLQQKSILKLQPYHLLLWEAIKDGCERGYTLFNFGGATLSANDGGLYEFKRKWADTITTVPSYFYSPTGLPLPQTDGVLFLVASKIWKKLPLFVIDKLSPYLIRQFV